MIKIKKNKEWLFCFLKQIKYYPHLDDGVYFLHYCFGDDDPGLSESFCIHIAFNESSINPADTFLCSCVQFIKPVQMLQTAVHQTWRGRVGWVMGSGGGVGLSFRCGVERKNPNCVFIRGVEGHFWEDRGVGRLLWKIKDILRNILRATKYSVLREKGQNRAKKNRKSSSKQALPAQSSPDANQPWTRSEIHCLYVTVRILHSVWAISNRSSWERTMVAGAASESHRNNSCTSNTVTGNQKNLLHGLFQKESSRNNTLPKERKKGTIPSSPAFPSRPLKALQIGLSEALFQPSLPLSKNAVDRSVPFSKTTKKKGQGKFWF